LLYQTVFIILPFTLLTQISIISGSSEL